MTVTVCDCCQSRIVLERLRIKVVEIHPHKGDRVEREADVCSRCAPKLQLMVEGPLPVHLADNEER